MKFVLLALALFATNAQAENFWGTYRDAPIQAVPPGVTLQKMMNLANDRDAKVYHRLSLMLDANTMVAGLYNEEIKASELSPFSAADGIHWLRDVESSEGAVLFEGQGRKVILIQGKLNRQTQEGRFQIRYLANGLSNSYEVCDLLLKKDDSGWFIQNAYTNRKVTSAKIITWSLGVTTIQGICPK
ncbi:MAG: hypothetical protein AB7K68_17500 [Bacteriovoracia bacterium]